MKIMSHRGYWKTLREKNSLKAFERSFSLGFGTETDIRDYCGHLVISHDIPDESCMRVNTVFEVYLQINASLPLALNIKADGLQQELKKLLLQYGIENYFVFDMSVPDGLVYLKNEINTFTRQSEYEVSPAFYEEAKGVWIDCFLDEWVTERVISQHLAYGKQVCLVSPELHKRDHRPFWQKLVGMAVAADARLMLCTDYPEDAKEWFDGKN